MLSIKPLTMATMPMMATMVMIMMMTVMVMMMMMTVMVMMMMNIEVKRVKEEQVGGSSCRKTLDGKHASFNRAPALMAGMVMMMMTSLLVSVLSQGKCFLDPLFSDGKTGSSLAILYTKGPSHCLD